MIFDDSFNPFLQSNVDEYFLISEFNFNQQILFKNFVQIIIFNFNIKNVYKIIYFLIFLNNF